MKPLLLLLTSFFLAGMAFAWTVFEMLGVSGSPTRAAGIVGFAVLVALAFVVLPPERRRFAYRLLQGRVSLQDFDIAPRKEYWPEIHEAIRAAKRNVIFIDGVSQSLLSADFYSVLAERLEACRELEIRFVILSNEQLFLRVQHHRFTSDRENHRTFEEVLKRKAEIEQLRSSVLDRVQPEMRTQAAKRIEVEEWHLPVHMVITKIDDKIYLSIPSQHRHSNTATIRLADPRNLLYQQADEYIKFIFRQGRTFLTKPSPELVPLVDNTGTVRMALPRDSVRALGYRTRTVFGFVVDREGRLLLRRRGHGAHDNRDLWDKSFGGHEMWGIDDTVEHLAERELLEELITGETPSIYFSGEASDLISITRSGQKIWWLVRLGRWKDYVSFRRDNREDVAKPLDVSLFVCCCPEPERVSAATAETAELRWVPLTEYEHFLKTENVTADLKDFFLAPEFRELQEFAQLIRRRDHRAGPAPNESAASDRGPGIPLPQN